MADRCLKGHCWCGGRALANHTHGARAPRWLRCRFHWPPPLPCFVNTNRMTRRRIQYYYYYYFLSFKLHATLSRPSTGGVLSLLPLTIFFRPDEIKQNFVAWNNSFFFPAVLTSVTAYARTHVMSSVMRACARALAYRVIFFAFSLASVYVSLPTPRKQVFIFRRPGVFLVPRFSVFFSVSFITLPPTSSARLCIFRSPRTYAKRSFKIVHYYLLVRFCCFIASCADVSRRYFRRQRRIACSSSTCSNLDAHVQWW